MTNVLVNTITFDDLRRDYGGCERAWRAALDRAGVPYAKILGVRRYDAETVRAALLAPLARETPPRAPGRPRKIAAA